MEADAVANDDYIPDPTQRLSKNFTLGEFLRSDTAERNEKLVEEQRRIPQAYVANLAYLCTTVLQPVRDTFRYPMRISSGYRSKGLNKAVNGSATSKHCFGQAADVQISDAFLTDRRFEPLRAKIRARINYYSGKEPRSDVNANFYLFAFVCLRRSHLDIDQVIHEYGEGFGRPAWVHVAAAPGTEQNKSILVYGHYWTAAHSEAQRTGAWHTVDLREAMGFGVRPLWPNGAATS